MRNKVVKQYLLFMGEDYYPKGGAEDLIGVFNSLEEVYTKVGILKDKPIEGSFPQSYYSWANMFCVETGVIWVNDLNKDVWRLYIKEEI